MKRSVDWMDERYFFYGSFSSLFKTRVTMIDTTHIVIETKKEQL